MTKSLKRGLILSFILLLFISLFAFMFNYQRASAAVVTDTGEWAGGKFQEVGTLNNDKKLILPGNDISGRTVFFDIASFMEDPYDYYNTDSITIKSSDKTYKLEFRGSDSSKGDLIISLNDETIYRENSINGIGSIKMPAEATVVSVTGSFYAPGDGSILNKESTTFLYLSDSYDGIEAETPADTNENPESDNFLDEISAWLETNTGIAVSSGGIVVIGVIILLLIFTKRR